MYKYIAYREEEITVVFSLQGVGLSITVYTVSYTNQWLVVVWKRQEALFRPSYSNIKSAPHSK